MFGSSEASYASRRDMNPLKPNIKPVGIRTDSDFKLDRKTVMSSI